jgi:hypothetical protein
MSPLHDAYTSIFPGHQQISGSALPTISTKGYHLRQAAPPKYASILILLSLHLWTTEPSACIVQRE